MRICVIPNVHGVGGMVSFKQKFSAALRARGVEICEDLKEEPYQAVLLIGGTRQLTALWRARRRGVRIVQRLDGINWLHRRIRTGWRHFLRAEINNLLLAFTRRVLAHHLVYQSEFARRWWEAWHGNSSVPATVIYNGVDLHQYTPEGPHQRPADRFRLLLVEGNLQGGYEIGLETAVRFVEGLSRRQKVELMVVGQVQPAQRQTFQSRTSAPILWAGRVSPERIPELDRSAHLLYAADLNAACPNSVIEAMACGLPVLAFATGALPELVRGEAGRLVPYGGNVWQLDPPDVNALICAGEEILAQQPRFRQAARARAEEFFDLDKMVDRYLDVLVE